MSNFPAAKMHLWCYMEHFDWLVEHISQTIHKQKFTLKDIGVQNG